METLIAQKQRKEGQLIFKVIVSFFVNLFFFLYSYLAFCLIVFLIPNGDKKLLYGIFMVSRLIVMYLPVFY